MAKTLKDFLNERQLGPMVVKNPDEQKFIDKHAIAKVADRNGNDDELFKGSKVKMIDRKKERKGYNPGEDEAVYEELKGGQVKLDKNHNGKLDAHDFNLLRKKKKVNEASYKDGDTRMGSVGPITTDAERAERAKKYREKMMKKESADYLETDLKKRKKNNDKAVEDMKKMGSPMKNPHFGEEAEQIDELSRKTLGSYAKKAKDQMSRSDTIAGREMGSRYDGQRPSPNERKHNQRADKRYRGLDMAISKLAKEEVEIEEKLDMKKASMGTVIKDFQKSDAPQFKGKSQKKRQVMAIAAKLSAERGGKPLNKEERLLANLGDLAESHKRTLLDVFAKLNEDNQRKFMTTCETPEGIEQMLNFAIQYRGE